MFQDEIEDFLRKHVQDAPEEFISELAEYLIKQVSKCIFFYFMIEIQWVIKYNLTKIIENMYLRYFLFKV